MSNNKETIKLIDQELIWVADCIKEITETMQKWQSRLLDKKGVLLRKQEATPLQINSYEADRSGKPDRD